MIMQDAGREIPEDHQIGCDVTSRDGGCITWLAAGPFQAVIVVLLFGISNLSVATGAEKAAEPKALPLPGETFLVGGRTAFLIPAQENTAKKPVPWVWYAPTLPGLPERFVQNAVLLGATLKWPPDVDMPRAYRAPRRVDATDEIRDTKESPREDISPPPAR